MALIAQPPQTACDTQDRTLRVVGPSEGWRAWFNAVYNITNALTMSGTTAQRPSSFLFAGRIYFDTSLGAQGRPIWRNKSNTGWVDSAGGAI